MVTVTMADSPFSTCERMGSVISKSWLNKSAAMIANMASARAIRGESVAKICFGATWMDTLMLATTSSIRISTQPV